MDNSGYEEGVVACTLCSEHSVSSPCEDCYIVGSRGTFPNINFPHLREECGVFFFDSDDASNLFCSKCFCYVCDVPASICTSWKRHRYARSTHFIWQNMREMIKKFPNCIYPYLEGTELLHRISQDAYTKRTYEGLENMMSKSNKVSDISLHRTQVLSLFRMSCCKNKPCYLHTYNTNTTQQIPLFGGILADEMGPGKSVTTMCCLLSAKKLKLVKREAALELTLVVVPAFLIVQWTSELSRRAFNLRVLQLDAVQPDFIGFTVESIKYFDVIVTTAESKLHPYMMCRITRVVIDEAHLLLDSTLPFTSGSALKFAARPSSCVSTTNSILKHRWLITGTPFRSYSINEVNPLLQCLFDAPHIGSKKVQSILNDKLNIKDLKRLIIRHITDRKFDKMDTRNISHSNLNCDNNDVTLIRLKLSGVYTATVPIKRQISESIHIRSVKLKCDLPPAACAQTMIAFSERPSTIGDAGKAVSELIPEVLRHSCLDVA